MLAEKKTLLGLLVDWFTGWSAVSPGHWPFCARASISVLGAPASSLATGSQVLVLKPGVEICAPVCVATALLCTAQLLAPRLETSLAPVPEGELTVTAAVRAAAAARPGPCATVPCGVAAAGAPWALDTSQASAVADTAAAAKRRERGRMFCLIAGHSCPAAVAANDGCPRL